MSGAQLFIRQDLGLSDVQVEVLTGSMNLFMLVSILGAGWAADLLGRRGTLVLANAFLMAGALAMSAGGSYAALVAARFVTSVGVGFARVVAPVYNAEISPASTRGVLSSLLDVRICIYTRAGIVVWFRRVPFLPSFQLPLFVADARPYAGHLADVYQRRHLA
jgi:MFS family permease